MPFYAITKKNGWIIVHRILNCIQKVCWWYFVLFSSKEHLQLFVDYMNKQHRCIKFTFESEQNNTFSFLDINITVKITNLKHLFIENLLPLVLLHTVKVTLINFTRSHWFSLSYLTVILFARTTHYSIWKFKN